MKIQSNQLDEAVQKNIITPVQAQQIRELNQLPYENTPTFRGLHIAYYFGAMVTLFALGLLFSVGSELLGRSGFLILSLLYLCAFYSIGWYLYFKQKMRVPGGLLFTLAVCMVPFVVASVQYYRLTSFTGSTTGFVELFLAQRDHRFITEMTTLVVGSATLYFVRYPFLTAPLALFSWLFALDLEDALFRHTEYSWHNVQIVSVLFSLVMIFISYWADKKTKEDYSFWGYLFGLTLFSTSLVPLIGHSIFFLFISLAFVFISIWLKRKTFLVFGAGGVFYYLSFLVYEFIKSTLLFAFALSLIGLFIIFCTAMYYKYKKRAV